MAVLVNADSYSAAEFLAAQLQESAGAAVVGEQTSGKGIPRCSLTCPTGSAMGLSTARYFTGSGKSLIGTGLTPDPAGLPDAGAAEGPGSWASWPTRTMPSCKRPYRPCAKNRLDRVPESFYNR